MSWFRKSPPRPAVEMQVPSVEFTGEQDGPPEQSLKQRLIELFERERAVCSAYLPRVTIEGQAGVALCVRAQGGSEESLVAEIASVFKAIFGAREHLDIIFIDADQEADVARVCRPFFEKIV